MKKSLFICAVFLIAMTGLNAFDIIKDSKPLSKIIIGKNASSTEKFAAEELQRMLRKISGAELKIESTGKAARNDIVIGTPSSCPAVKQVENKLNMGAADSQKIAIYAISGNLYLAGNEPRDALYAVYTFLDEEFDVKWLWPGESGEFFPSRKTIVVKPGLTINRKPALRYRGYRPGGRRNNPETELWMGRNRMDFIRQTVNDRHRNEILRRLKRGFYLYFAGHNCGIPRKYFKAHPEYFAMVDGKRDLRQACWSNDKAAELIAENILKHFKINPETDLLSLSARDNSCVCQCPECAKYKKANELFYSFIGKIVKKLRKHVSPKVKFGVYAYSTYAQPPEQQVPLDYVELCLYNRCYRHDLDDPQCKVNKKAREFIAKWQKKNVELLVFGYEFDLFIPKREFVNMSGMFADQAKWLQRKHFSGYSTETRPYEFPSKDSSGARPWNNFRFSLFANARLLWNPDEPIDKILDAWCRHAYGSAAEPMKKYYAMMGKAWCGSPKDISYVANPPSSAVAGYITGARLAEARELFKLAKSNIEKNGDSEKNKFYLRQVELEEKLLEQWSKLYDAYNRIYSKSTIKIPVYQSSSVGKDFAKSPLWEKAVTLPEFLDNDGKPVKGQKTELLAFATPDALYLKAVCFDNSIDKLKAEYDKRDDNIWSDECIELFVTSKYFVPGKYAHMAVNSAGGQYDAKGFNISSLRKNWNSSWQVKTEKNTKSWIVFMKIPARDFGMTFKPGEELKFGVDRQKGRRKDLKKSGFPIYSVHNMASLGCLKFVSPDAVTSAKTIAVFTGGYDPHNLAVALSAGGWQVEIAKDEEALARSVNRGSPVILVRYGKKRLPYSFFLNTIGPAVKKGAMFIFSMSGFVPDYRKYFFGDADLKIDSGTWIPKSKRKKSMIAKGDWSLKPHDLKKIFRGSCPSYGFNTSSAKWLKLVSAKGLQDQDLYYLMFARYGKGAIVLTSAPIMSGGNTMFGQLKPDTTVKLLDNLYTLWKSGR